MNNLIILLCLPLLVFCNSQPQKIQLEAGNTEESYPIASLRKDTSDAPDFLSYLDSMRLFFGAIQSHKAPKQVFPMGENNNSLQFDIVWVPKSKRYFPGDLDSLVTLFDSEKNKEFISFNILVFELIKIPKEELQDEYLQSPYLFPATVKIYHRLNGTWYSLGEHFVTDFQEYSALQWIESEKTFKQ